MNTKRKCMLALTAAVLLLPVFASSGTGGEVTYDGDYAVHTFTNGGTFAFSGGEVEVLLVGGGGGGGAFGGGGGGGGQVVSAILTLPVADSFKEDAYEAAGTVFGPSVAEDLVAGQLELLTRLHN